MYIRKKYLQTNEGKCWRFRGAERISVRTTKDSVYDFTKIVVASKSSFQLISFFKFGNFWPCYPFKWRIFISFNGTYLHTDTIRLHSSRILIVSTSSQ